MVSQRRRWENPPWLYATWDTVRGLAAISGLEAEEIVRRVGPLSTDIEPVYSRRMRGWVVPECVFHDVVAYAKSIHEWVYVRTVIGPMPGQLNDSPGGPA
jgi:hypothetical protein